uniref:telomeric repeat binding factor a n=1 Tax=Doryrhamphus excisus TaxID=161450 RepID=UPI0025AE7E66|nr:telomeric repeat binding factor a [Doryrhamphus excisus]
MADENVGVNHSTDTESIVNRWTFDYYFSLAFELFKTDQYEGFCEIRDVLESILRRPLSSNDVIHAKILVLQLLSRINEGENLDLVFETDSSMTPLESALSLLGNMSERSDVPPEDLESVCASVKEMMVKVFIKNRQFGKAKEVLNKHFSKSADAKKTLFMDLISRRSNKHKVIEEMDLRELKNEVLTFSLNLFTFTVPFFHKAAKRLIEERERQGDDSMAIDEPDVSPTTTQPNKSNLLSDHSLIQKSRLALAYQTLAKCGLAIAFSQLEDIVENEMSETKCLASDKVDTSKDSEHDELFQRHSGSPVEAALAGPHTQTDAPPQSKTGSPQVTTTRKKRQLYTVSKFVIEPDSQPTLLLTASEEQEVPVTVEEPRESETGHKADEDVVTTKRHRRATNTFKKRFSASMAAESAQSEEQSNAAANKQVPQENHHHQTSPNKRSTPSDSDELSLNSEDVVQDSPVNYNTTTPKKPAHHLQKHVQRNTGTRNTDEVLITDTLDSSPPASDSPQQSSTPNNREAKDTGSSYSKWNNLYSKAKESKVVWTYEDDLSNESPDKSSSLGQKKRKWTEEETQKLKEGVKKFGEGNWSKIKSYYSFSDRTNVHLKDRWRTMKKLNMV